MRIGILLAIIIIFVSMQNDVLAQKKKKVSHKDSLVGNWVTVPNPLEASYLRMEFHPDGKFLYKLSSEWNGKYSLDGTKLTSTYFIRILNKTKTDTSTVLIYADTLVQIIHLKGKETTLKMVRLGGTKKGAGIIGTWITSDPDAQYVTITYNTNGTFEVKKILREFKGNYTVKGSNFSVFSEGRFMFKSDYIFERGQLLMYSKTANGHIKMERAKD